MGQKRIFLACEVGSAACSEIEKVGQKLKAASFQLKLTPLTNLHITLAFLPKVEAEKLTEISKLTKKICSNFPKFLLVLDNLGAFPNLKLPRVVFVSLTGETSTLANLARKIQHQIETLGFYFEHERFSPHITIGRIKSYVPKTERRGLGEAIQRWGKIEPVKISVRAVSIFESIPTSAGHIHKLLEKISLGK